MEPHSSIANECPARKKYIQNLLDNNAKVNNNARNQQTQQKKGQSSTQNSNNSKPSASNSEPSTSASASTSNSKPSALYSFAVKPKPSAPPANQVISDSDSDVNLTPLPQRIKRASSRQNKTQNHSSQGTSSQSAPIINVQTGNDNIFQTHLTIAMEYAKMYARGDSSAFIEFMDKWLVCNGLPPMKMPNDSNNKPINSASVESIRVPSSPAKPEQVVRKVQTYSVATSPTMPEQVVKQLLPDFDFTIPGTQSQNPNIRGNSDTEEETNKTNMPSLNSVEDPQPLDANLNLDLNPNLSSQISSQDSQSLNVNFSLGLSMPSAINTVNKNQIHSSPSPSEAGDNFDESIATSYDSDASVSVVGSVSSRASSVGTHRITRSSTKDKGKEIVILPKVNETG